ncbi:hypothetical protein G5I_03797 [Acromyrmex echinatior]|uniref:Uncharacterized protein n=1 Tax=Acromyrmex echinatior TaxID=103372 RepID=F4WDX2_ACREC|nr:hypothetical protein G5I_03797 [Acromyrmex echinatior]
MRHENARVGKGGLGAARKRRRCRIDASTPGPRERNGKLMIQLHRLYIKILEDLTVSRTHLPKNFKHSFLRVRSSLRNEENKRAIAESASYLGRSST